MTVFWNDDLRLCGTRFPRCGLHNLGVCGALGEHDNRNL